MGGRPLRTLPWVLDSLHAMRPQLRLARGQGMGHLTHRGHRGMQDLNAVELPRLVCIAVLVMAALSLVPAPVALGLEDEPDLRFQRPSRMEIYALGEGLARAFIVCGHQRIVGIESNTSGQRDTIIVVSLPGIRVRALRAGGHSFPLSMSMARSGFLLETETKLTIGDSTPENVVELLGPPDEGDESGYTYDGPS